MAKVSIIIPIYGVEKYIEQCAHSLFEQTLDDIEYLFIDDCTPDNSINLLMQVLEEYPNRKSQVIIHKMDRNSGQAVVRKWGIMNATGEYIIHCDSDDWVDTNMYRDMYEKAKQEDADVVVCDFMITDGNGNNRRVKSCNSKNKDKYIENLINQRDSWSLCNKLFKKSIYHIKDIEYPNGDMGEDMALCLQMMWYCNKISYIEQPYYYYYQNPESITKSQDRSCIIHRFEQGVANISIVYDFYKQKSIYDKYKYGIEIILFNMKNKIRPLLGEWKYYRIWLTTFPKINYTILLNPQIHIIEKMRHILALFGIYRKE